MSGFRSWFMQKVLRRTGARSGVRTPGLWRKVLCFIFTHGEIMDAGTATGPVRGSRPMPLRQCADCGELMVQRTARNANVKAFGG